MYEDEKINILKIDKSYIEKYQCLIDTALIFYEQRLTALNHFLYNVDVGQDYINELVEINNFNGLKKSNKTRLKNLKKYVHKVNKIKTNIIEDLNDISEASRKFLFSIFSKFVDNPTPIYSERNFLNLLNYRFDTEKVLKFAISILKSFYNLDNIHFSVKKIIKRLVRQIDFKTNKNQFVDIENSLRKILTTYSYFRFNTEEDALIIKNSNAVFTAQIF